MNVSLEQGVFPDRWKTAIIRPLLKKLGLELFTSNYRPVSNLPFLSKVLEKIVLARYNDHCDRYNLIPSFQLAYRPKHSCETSTVKLVNDLLWSMERKEATAVAVIDLSAAFDTVDHNILIDLLHETFGIGDKALRWFQSYLENRFCKVKIGKDYSEKKSLDFSVPQGSCVGPVLYLSYAASISDVVSDVSDEGDPRLISIIGFTDDHAMKKSFIPTLEDDEEVCIANLQACLSRVKEWMDSMRLKMNEGKTKFIIIGSSHQIAKCSMTQLKVNNVEVQRSSVINYLGTHMDEKLSFKEHITAKCRTAAINFQRIKIIQRVLTEQAKETLVLGTVMSHLDYCNAILCDLPNTDISQLQTIQNMCAKLVKGATKYTSNEEVLYQLHWLPIRQRIKFKILTLVHKCINCQAPTYLQNLLIHHSGARQGP